MELTITASILALIVYGRLLWIDFDSNKYTSFQALFKWATLFVSMVFNFEAATTAMNTYTGSDVRAFIFIIYSAGAFGKIFICLLAKNSGFTGGMIGGPIMNDFFIVFIGAAIQRDLTGDKAYSNLFLAASIFYMYASFLYVVFERWCSSFLVTIECVAVSRQRHRPTRHSFISEENHSNTQRSNAHSN